MRRRFVDTRYGQCHLREGGDGPPLVLLHRTASSSTQFGDVWELLAARFHLYALDTPGFGDSVAPPESPWIEGYGEAFREAVDALDLPRFHLLGHRTGAAIGAEFAARHPNRVRRLVLSGLADWPADDRAALNVPRRQRRQDLDGSHLAAMWELLTRNLGPGATAFQIERAVFDGMRAAPNTHWAYEACYAQDLHAALRAVTAPTLLLYGSRDEFLPYLNAHLALLRHGESCMFRDCHALTMIHQPEAFASVVAEFLAR
jgi:pimeloyl-ACP methyl ester carboxylesterase